MTGTARIIRGDARDLPLADESVDLCVTSPPYWSLRSYSDNGEHYEGQVGDELTPGEFVDALIAATAEMARVLKPTGSIFVNLGDKYAQNIERSRNGEGGRRDRSNVTTSVLGQTVVLPSRNNGVPTKSLIGLPWRYALRCIDDLGLILRAEIVLDKKNGLPESVTDRVRRSHEQVFHFVKQARYYSAVDEIREPHAGNRGGTGSRDGTARMTRSMAPGQPKHTTLNTTDGHPLGKLPGSVWEYVSQPFTAPAHLGVDHYAAFNMALPRRIIQCWSPPGICTGCGEGRRPVSVRFMGADAQGRIGTLHSGDSARLAHHTERKMLDGLSLRTITGYACACPDTTAPTVPSVVLDPFGGTGTTALVAKALGRTGISIDMSHDYSRLAQWRTTDPGQLAAAMQVPKPPAENNGQQDLFGETA